MSTNDKVYVRKVSGEPDVSLSFIFSSDLVAERRFNFNRKQDEPLKLLLDRINNSINKQIEKDKKKLKQKKDPSESQPDVSTKCIDHVKAVVYRGQEKLDESLSIFDAFQKETVLQVGDKRYEVDVNTPKVTKLKLPKIILAGFPVYPAVETEFSESMNSEFTWYRSGLPDFSDASHAGNVASASEAAGEIWEEVAKGYVYLTGYGDVHRKLKLKCVPKGDSQMGFPLETVSIAPVEVGPGECPFDRRQIFTKELTNVGSFRVMSYNILADLYADSDFSRNELFPTCPAYALEFDYRKQLLLKEIQGYNCDIMCLQEVDAKMFQHCLVPGLASFNYDGIFTTKSGKVAEGLACFYNKNKFRIQTQHDIILSEALMNDPGCADLKEIISKNEQLKAKILERTTVLQVVLLESLEIPHHILCVANTHLYFKPDADNIRLLQATICLRHLEQIVALKSSENPTATISLLLCGDFNSTPEFGVYQLMTTQFIPEDHMDWKSVPEEAIQGFFVSHPFSLISASGTPVYTNYTVGFNGCLDYIFADTNCLNVEEVIPLPSHEEVTQSGAIPSATIPSDHLPLICVLKWIGY